MKDYRVEYKNNFGELCVMIICAPDDMIAINKAIKTCNKWGWKILGIYAD